MQTNDWLELIRQLEQGRGNPHEAMAPLLRETQESRSVVEDVQRLAASEPRRENTTAPPIPPSAAVSAPEGDSTATAVLKTIGMVSGVGPLVTGLLKLFGSGGGTTEPPVLTPYSLPERVSVEAGVAQDRSFVPLSYSQSGIGRSSAPRAESSGPLPQIQVNVSAMDSRSFLDHSDEIARAVREAMLRSHSLNDIVAEL
jgi:hypothetical protein